MRDPLVKTYKRGWGFPPTFTHEGANMVESAEDVHQSMSILFKTMPGERIMRPRFGCDLQQFMFANINSALFSDIETQINDSILRYEPRAQIISINFAQDSPASSQLFIQVNYRLSGSDLEQQWQGALDIVDGQGIQS
ncbi:GPW/gp25 family protein [Shewanella sp. YLB-07]|uniref:GPW/gp25 family protein n=1 Tax=Shewanella sp. YLB-07 TaxID=2601268 RepID=UPI00128BCC7C|nr:GPW/gp25 family protein [Shewanella sp. YLB-07]MPY24382.1 GPW/gp25 family protein [Shewanella sp. YLB-07]